VGGRRALRRVAVAAAACALLAVVPAADARSSGFDAGALDAKLRAEHGVLSVLIECDGKLLFERYYRGDAREARLDVFSITKSVVSTLLGIATSRGEIRSLDARLGEFLPRYVQRARDRRVRLITLRELLTMTSGYRDVAAARSDDWIRTQVDRPLAADPGRSWSYDNGSFHLLSVVLAKATGRSTSDYAQRVLFAPLGIARPTWATDGQGHNLGNSGIRLSSRDLLRIGELYLHDGRWRGRQLVPAAYVHAATRPFTKLGHGYGYGYGWWSISRPAGFAALGYGGQEIAVFPKRRLVVVLTGAESRREHVLADLVLPALNVR
jgi:CubicO group peptidase (beta-lactamase class C family)